MRAYRFDRFGIDHLRLQDVEPTEPGPGQVAVDVKAISLNYRDLLVVTGKYNPKLLDKGGSKTPMSDGSGVIGAVGQSVEGFAVGDRVVSHFITGWVDGPFRGDYAKTSLGTPGAGLAAQRVVLPATGVVPIPAGYDFSQAATLPIAALTAWSALVTEGKLQPAGTVLTLGTGGVSVFALQIAKAMGARVIITSSRDEKLERARDLGADGTINYRADPQWHRKVLEFTEGQGVDVTVETGGAGTLDRSMLSTRPGGVISLLGVLAGVKAEVSTILMVMKRLHIAGIYVDSRSAFEQMNRFLGRHRIEPVIDRTFAFGDLPEALRYLESGSHFGKIVLTV